MQQQKNYDLSHLQKMVLTEHRVKRVYEQAIDAFMRIYDWMEQPQDEMETLRFDKQPILRPHVARIMQRLRKGVHVLILDGVKASWMLSQEKNDALEATFSGRGSDARRRSPLESSVAAQLTKVAAAARTYRKTGLQAFLSRKVGGLNFSERVWKLTDGFKEEMEMAIELGMREGRSADDLSRDIRQYLQQPDMLFRRIRDKSTGMFRLSKRAAAYHPGRGVYRSSYKNARRLAGTEMNMAYRTADHERWQQLDFVVGFEVRLSNNHTELNRQGKAVRIHDMCDELQGRYPKTFKFVGWHPHCRCFAVPILKTEGEMDRNTERILSGKEPSEESENTVQEMPKAFEDWIEKKRDKIALALEGKLQMPLFIKDNFVGGDPEKGYVWEADIKKQGRKAASSAHKMLMGYKPRSKYSAQQMDNFKEIEEALGIKRGKPMSFDQAAGGANLKKGRENCAACVVAHELRLRGFDVSAKDYVLDSHKQADLLSDNTRLIWRTWRGEVPEFTAKIGGNEREIRSTLQKQTQMIGSRYHLGWDEDENDGHIVTLERVGSGEEGLIIYDPQTNEFLTVNYILEAMMQHSR